MTADTSAQKWRIRIWAVLLSLAGIWELIGLKRGGKMDTLSEYVWSKTHTPVVRSLACGLCSWLVWHFSYGEGVPLSRRDLIAASVGLALGAHSSVVVRRRRE